MILVIQRVSAAYVIIDGSEKAEIGKGLLVLIGIGHDDTREDISWLSKKLINLRIFTDTEGKMNLSIQEIQGDLLLVSQFTLFASTKKGNRPSFTDSAPPAIAIPLYNEFIETLEKDLGKSIKRGKFGADMQVSLTNDGPVTIIMDSKNKR